MKKMFLLAAALFLTVPFLRAADPVAKDFLRYVYGTEGINLTNICHPSDDLWMLHGRSNAPALNMVKAMKFGVKTNVVYSEMVGTDLCFVEMREGKVDPAINLASIYDQHRQMVRMLLYAALSEDKHLLDQLVTDRSKLQIIGPKAPPGDMDQYGSIVEIMPVVRSSSPAEDAKSKSVTYRIPLGNEMLKVTLVQEKGEWKIDTSKTVRISLEYFYR